MEEDLFDGLLFTWALDVECFKLFTFAVSNLIQVFYQVMKWIKKNLSYKTLNPTCTLKDENSNILINDVSLQMMVLYLLLNIL